MVKINKIFGIGWSKTGTTSLNEALKILGIKITHDKTLIKAAIKYEKEKGLPILSTLPQFRGFTEWPIRDHFKEIDKVIPNSKFILTVRDLKSLLKSLLVSARTKNIYMGTPLVSNKRTMKKWYETYCRDVMYYFKNRPKDLLVMNICAGEGWEKLCDFLEVPIPDVPFPYLNTAESLKQKLKNQMGA